MAKSKRKPFHKIIIHPNRWLIWAIAYTLIVAVALVAYIRITEINFDSQMVPETVFTPWHSYTNDQLGFSVRYPAEWSIEASSTKSIDFLPPNISQEGVTIGVYTPATAKDIRNSLTIISEKPITINGETGSIITSNPGHQDYETVILVVHQNKLYYFSGPDSEVREFASTFQFVNLAPQK